MGRWQHIKLWWQTVGGGKRLAPHEKAAAGLSTYGRQPEPPTGQIGAKARLKATMSIRVWRAITDTWEEVK